MVVRTRLERTTVRETEIAAAFKTGGDVWQNMRKAGNYWLAIAQTKTVPKRTGALAASLGFRVLPAFNRFQTMISIGTPLDYAKYTLGGTGPVIRSNRGKYINENGKVVSAAMVVRPAPFSHYSHPTLRTSVRGQRANDWMDLTTRVMFRGMGLN